METQVPYEITKDTLVLMNFGTLSFLGGILLKVVWAWSKADSALNQLKIDMTTENKLREKDMQSMKEQFQKDIDAAHDRIRELKGVPPRG